MAIFKLIKAKKYKATKPHVPSKDNPVKQNFISTEAYVIFCISISVLIVVPLYKEPLPAPNDNAVFGEISCHSPYIIDGDTFDCNGTRIRLQGIDAPELEGHCRIGRKCATGDAIASKNQLTNITRSAVSCAAIELDKYGRTLANCRAQNIDLSCTMIASGHAMPRYARLHCA